MKKTKKSSVFQFFLISFLGLAALQVFSASHPNIFLNASEIALINKAKTGQSPCCAYSQPMPKANSMLNQRLHSVTDGGISTSKNYDGEHWNQGLREDYKYAREISHAAPGLGTDYAFRDSETYTYWLKVEAESVFGQGTDWNAQFAANALTEFNALKVDPSWVAKLKDLPDNTWLQANSKGIPALPSRNRAEVPMVYMPKFKAMFYTCGDHEEFGSYNSDSWVYSVSANTWVQMWPNYMKNSPLNQEPYPTDRPAGRCSFGLSFDTDRAKLVLRGGANAGSKGLFTWEYDPATNKWQKTAPQNAGYNRIEDNNLGFIPGFGTVEVGGDRGTLKSETWVYRPNASNWEKIKTNGAPPGTHNSRLVWASRQKRLIFWAGTTQLWTFDPATSTWENISPTSGPNPSGFYRHGMAYDLANDVVIMYGSKNESGTLSMGPWVYSFQTETWKDMNPDFRPPNGSGPESQSLQMAYDTEHNVVIITGNRRGTWVYRYKKSSPN